MSANNSFIESHNNGERETDVREGWGGGGVGAVTELCNRRKKKRQLMNPFRLRLSPESMSCGGRYCVKTQ